MKLLVTTVFAWLRCSDVRCIVSIIVISVKLVAKPLWSRAAATHMSPVLSSYLAVRKAVECREVDSFNILRTITFPVPPSRGFIQ